VRWLTGNEPVQVLDLGAGTGKLTRVLVALGHDVIAVEPSPEMIAQLRRALPGVEALEGAAERIPVPDGRFDVVTAGQAFHWFEPERALPEIARVLRPGGTLGLVWNLWDDESAVVARLNAVLPPYVPSEGPLSLGERFGPVEEASFDWVRPYGRDELVDSVGTTSSVATLAPDDRADRLEAVGRVWDEEAADGVLAVPFRTEAHRATRL
jgi:SAM-dependent methyltransferase